MKRIARLVLGTLVISLACEPADVVVWSAPAGVSPVGGTAGAAGAEVVAGTTGQGGSSGQGGAMSSAGTGGTTAPMDGAGAAGDSGEGGSGSTETMPCTDTSECPPNFTCEKESCSAPTGVCEPRPVFCPPEPRPVCGCDQVTYWNDCVRRQSGGIFAFPGECRAGARLCDTSDDCGVPNASCARIFPFRPDPSQICSPKASGICWVVPAVCEPNDDPLIWRECQPPGGNAPPACVSTCAAIASERPHVPPLHGEGCY